tara:strand:+ start:395 stop:643 length:249 start_codon:yes stop_codon:yes gene_type:complete
MDIMTDTVKVASMQEMPTPDWYHLDPEDDEILEEEETEDLLDDDELGDLGWSPEDYWFTPDGGLTGDAYNFLATIDNQGDFV